MELRWPGAYGPAKSRRSGGGATPCSKRLAVVLGSTGIVHSAPIDAPRGYAISRRPLPPWPEALSPGVSRGQFDDADHEVLAMAIAPLADISDVFFIAWHPRPAHAALPPGLCRGRFDLVADALAPFTDIAHVAWEPRPTHAAPRGANHTTMLCNVPNCSKRFQLLVLDPFEPFGRIHLTLERGSETRPGSPVVWEGFTDPSEEALDSISSTKDGLADEDSNLMVKLKFLTYKIIDTFVPDPFNQEASYVENIPDPPDRIVKNPDRTCLSGRLWCQTQCLTLLVFIFILIPTVNADVGMMCPVRSINDFLPKTTCPVIKLKGRHWSHSKFTREEKEENRPVEHPDSTQYFLGTNFTRCTVLQDLHFVLGVAALCQVLWGLNQQKQVRILSFNRSVIFLWIDTLLASIVYYACWSIYGSLLSLSKPKEAHGGLHIQYINLAGCSMYALLLLFLIGRHGMAWRSIVYRLVALFCLLLPPFILWHMEPNNDNIFRIGVLGFCATVAMYVFKWFTIVGFKGPTTILNVAAILLFLCCGFPDTNSLYGCAQIGSFGFRFIDIIWSVLVMSPSEWASMRASIQGKWRFIAVTAKRMVATTRRNLRPRGARDGCALPFVR